MDQLEPLNIEPKLSVSSINTDLGYMKTLSRISKDKKQILEDFKPSSSLYLRRTSSRITPLKKHSRKTPKASTLPKLEPLAKEFTFTGYDIDKDVIPKYEVSDIHAGEEERKIQIYKDMCKKLGIIPVSYIVRRLAQKELCMRGYGLGTKDTRALAVALVENNTLEKLILRDNNIECEGAKSLSAILATNESIQELDISNNNIGISGACEVCLSLKDNNSVRKLTLSENQLGNHICLHISTMLETNYCIKELNLSHNMIEDPGGMVLGDILAQNDTLEVLDLSWNNIRLSGATAVAYGLSKNNALKILNLAWNGFSQKGSRAVGEALARNKCLQELDMSSNRINMEAAASLVKGLSKNETLSSLKLSGNPITQKGAIMILKALEKMQKSGIREIDLHDICVDAAFVELLNTIQNNRVLRVRHGQVVRHSKSAVPRKVTAVFQGDPRTLVFSMMEKDNLRVVDLFHKMDVDHSFSVTRDEFKTGILEAGLPVTEGQLDDLVDMMDEDGNGEIGLGELLTAEKSYKRKQRKEKKITEAQARSSEMDFFHAFEKNLSTPSPSKSNSRRVSPSIPRISSESI